MRIIREEYFCIAIPCLKHMPHKSGSEWLWSGAGAQTVLQVAKLQFESVPGFESRLEAP